MKTKIFALLSVLSILMLLITSPVYAQQVSAGVGGIVVDSSGNPVVGASVQIVHVPSGTTRTATTQEGGNFSARGLRVGGPYTITASQDGFSPQARENVFLQLGDPEYLGFTLGNDGDTLDLDTLSVVGAVQSRTFQPDNMGSSTTITREQIENLPTINRSVADFARLDPRITITDRGNDVISVAGANNRFNSFTIDGASANDEFGLIASGQPAQVGQPLSIDWLEEIVVQISPYDVTQSGFTGAGISAVTKSGTNEFQGSLSYTYRDDSWIGDNENGAAFGELEETNKTVSLSGPIIKDKLFFFVGYEEQEKTGDSDATVTGLFGSGASTIFGDATTIDEINEIINIAQNQYGINPGTVGTEGTGDRTNEKFTAKLDWNINNFHRASFRYTNVEAGDPRVERDNNDYDLTTRFYSNTSETDTYAAHLYSDWSSNISTEFRYTSVEYHAEPKVQTQLPDVEIDITGGDLNFGTERFRHANILDTQADTLFFKLNYFTGLHSIDFGTQLESKEFNNLFVFNQLAQYRFDSVDDFRNGNTGVFYQLRVPSDPNDPNAARAIWEYDILSFFVQDTYQATGNLSLQFGLRYDQLSTSDLPRRNDLFASAFGFSNQGTVDGESLISPRFGFNWDLSRDRNRQLRGGVGLFMGSTPGVWLSNPYTNPGGTVQVFQCGSQRVGNTGCLDLDPNFGFTTTPASQPRVGGQDNARQDVDVVQDGFQLPSVWKMNLAWDEELPWWDLLMTVELEHTETKHGIHYEHLNLGTPTGTLPDGRNAYWADIATASGDRANEDTRFNDVVLLRNTNAGETTNATISFQKNWDVSWGSMFGRVAYSYNTSKDLNPGTSSRAISNWGNRPTFNPNEEIASRSTFEIRDRLTLLWSTEVNWFDFGATKFSAFFEHRAGRPYSLTFDGDANGDGRFDNDLFYVPSGPGDVIFTDPTEEAAFWSLVEGNKTLAANKGRVLGRGAFVAPDVNQLDIHIAQEINFGKWGTGEIYLDILNFGNLINDEWGHIDEVFGFTDIGVEFEGVDAATGKAIYSFDTRTDPDFTTRQDRDAQSRWAAQVGIRFNF